MFLLYAPREKFGLIPPGMFLMTPEVKFWSNVAFCPKQYWRKMHIQNGCRDISPKYFRKMRENRKLQTITIFATGGIGDSMWCMPIARALKEKHPAAHIVIITEKKNAPVWKYVPYVVGTLENAYWNVTGVMSKSDEVYDFGGVATVNKQDMKQDPIEAIFRAAEIPLPNDNSKCRPMLVVTIDEGKKAEKALKEKGINTRKDSIITIGTESSTSNRNWPMEYVKELTKALLAAGHKVIWLSREKENNDKFLDEETRNMGQVNLSGETDIRTAMAIISLSDLFIGPNSGLMVIATSLNIPTVGLFGAFNPKLRSKFYDRFTAVWGRVSCSPCNEHWTECRYGHPAPCMKKIMPSEVYKEAVRIIKRYPRHIIEKLPIE